MNANNMKTEKTKPGWSVNARKDGPVAKMLIDENNIRQM
jgi:hypothetical protein